MQAQRLQCRRPGRRRKPTSMRYRRLHVVKALLAGGVTAPPVGVRAWIIAKIQTFKAHCRRVVQKIDSITGAYVVMLLLVWESGCSSADSHGPRSLRIQAQVHVQRASAMRAAGFLASPFPQDPRFDARRPPTSWLPNDNIGVGDSWEAMTLPATPRTRSSTRNRIARTGCGIGLLSNCDLG